MAKRRRSAQAAVVDKPVPRRVDDDPWVWIEGLHELGFWQPLFNFRKNSGLGRARNHLRRLLALTNPDRELALYQDFRLNMGDLDAFEFEPDPEVRARYAAMSAQRPPEGRRSRREPSGDALQPPEPEEDSEGLVEDVVPETCPDFHRVKVGGKSKRRACVRKFGHKGKHKDRKGQKF